MKPTRDALLERFRQAFPEAAIQIEDESHLHVGHAGAAGGAGHFRVRVIDARFNGLQRIARHRLVYDAVSDWMPERVRRTSGTPAARSNSAMRMLADALDMAMRRAACV